MNYAEYTFYMTPTGIEPVLPPWKGDVLTAWPRSLKQHRIRSALSSPSRARTYNNSVNSRVLYHWAIEENVLLRKPTWEYSAFPAVPSNSSKGIPSKPNTTARFALCCIIIMHNFKSLHPASAVNASTVFQANLNLSSSIVSLSCAFSDKPSTY